VQQTPDGGYIIVGTTEASANKYGVYLVKTDAAGNVLWQQTFSAGANSTGRAVQQTTDGGYIIVGQTEEAGKNKVYLVKTDSSGSKQWQKTFGGGLYNIGTAVQQTDDGGYVIFGVTAPSQNEELVYLFKTDANGMMQWERYYSGDGNAVATRGQQTTDGGYIIAGATMVSGATKMNAYILKTDSSGNKEWQQKFAGSGNSSASNVTQTKDGGYAIFGTIEEAGKNKVYLVKTDSSGSKQWQKTFGGNDENLALDGQQTRDGGYIIAGITISSDLTKSTGHLIKADSIGNMQWEQNFAGNGNTIIFAMQQTNDDGYIIVGSTNSLSTNKANAYLVKFH
jgi:hypothetical protein